MTSLLKIIMMLLTGLESCDCVTYLFCNIQILLKTFMMLLMGLKSYDPPAIAKFTQNHYNVTNGLCDILALQ